MPGVLPWRPAPGYTGAHRDACRRARVKAANTRALGAEVIPYDRHSEDREAIARALVARDGGVLVPSYDDPDIVAGQGTVGLELLQDAGPLDAMLVCCSGGGLVAGCALAAEGLAVPTRIFAVEPQDFNDHQRSWTAASGNISSRGAHPYAMHCWRLPRVS